MKKIKIRTLILSVLLFTISSFLTHLLINPEPTLWGTLGYGLFAGLTFGVVFYFDREVGTPETIEMWN